MVIDAIHVVGSGGRFLSPDLSASKVDERMAARAGGSQPLAQLSAREREIFDLLARGFSSQRVADELSISIKTVETHRARRRARAADRWA